MNGGAPPDPTVAATWEPARSTPTGAVGAAAFAADLVALTKPRVTSLVVTTTLGGVWLAARTLRGSAPEPKLLAATLLGTALIVAGANALNMYLERDSDALMERTRKRPLPSGRMAPEIALGFGLALGAVSIPWLTFAVNGATGLLAALALVSYVLLYTPLKRVTSAALPIGAVPGAIPPLLGWTSVAGRVELGGLLLFGILFFWQLPHFLAIATFRKDDYARAGMKVLPVVRGERVTRWHMLVQTVLLLGVSAYLATTNVGGPRYLAAALVLGGAFLALVAAGLRAQAGRSWARAVFFGSMVYLVLLFAALVSGF